jgi:hypothetical protein
MHELALPVLTIRCAAAKVACIRFNWSKNLLLLLLAVL